MGDMMDKNRVLLLGAGLILIMVVAAVLYFTLASPGALYEKPLGSPKSCAAIDKSDKSLAAEIAYCMGDACAISCTENGCHQVLTQAECEQIDIVRTDLLYGKDGSPDCAWVQEKCKPSK